MLLGLPNFAQPGIHSPLHQIHAASSQVIGGVSHESKEWFMMAGTSDDLYTRGFGLGSAGCAALACSALVYLILAPSFYQLLIGRGAPFLQTADEKLETIFQGLLRPGHPESVLGHDAPPTDAMHFVDLGSGTGAVVRKSRRSGGFGRASGYEVNPSLFLFSSLLSAMSSDSERFYSSTIWDAPLADADVVYVYGEPTILPELGKKLGSECKDGALVISNAYAIPHASESGLRLIRRVPVYTAFWSMDSTSPLCVYRVRSD